MIGYYAHSHGSGHCNYASMFSRNLRHKMVIFTDRNYIFENVTRVIRLPNENTDGSEFDQDNFKEPCSLHYAPVSLKKILKRNTMILQEILSKDIKLLIIDVSVEIAMLARVSSIPYAYVRLLGNRNDLPHVSAFEGATFLLAYFPEAMESVDTPEWIKSKTVYLGFISRYNFQDAKSSRPIEYHLNGKKDILILSGYGGSNILTLDFENSDDNFYSIGPIHAEYNLSRIKQLGLVDSTRSFIEHADIIIAVCGLNTTSEILSLGKKFIAIAEERPFQEQLKTAQSLERMQWAVPWIESSSWQENFSKLKVISMDELPNFNSDTFERFCFLLCQSDFRASLIFDYLADFGNTYPKVRKSCNHMKIFKAT